MHRLRGFTLIELLVVIAILAILASMLLPSISKSQATARRIACVSNLRQVGIAIQTYAEDHDGAIPFGPKAPPFLSPANFYPSTGAPTSLLSLRSGAPVGLGLLLESHLGSQPRVLFCPGSDQPLSVDRELERVGTTQAQGSYYYRHASNTELFDAPDGSNLPLGPRIDQLGVNRLGRPIRTLVMDTQFVSASDLEEFGIHPRSSHGRAWSNLLFIDGSARSESNRQDRFTVDLRDLSQVRSAFGKILTAFENADARM